MSAAGFPPSAASALTLLSARRHTEVRELRARVPASQAELKTLEGRSERAQLREALRKDSARLAFLEAMPPMEPADMCSECASPAWHSMSTTISDAGITGGPCPAWPRWAQKVEEVRRQLLGLSGRAAEPPASPPEPIAVIEAGVPIENVMAQLATVQADHPGARVCQGKRNRWEIWPPGPAQP